MAAYGNPILRKLYVLRVFTLLPIAQSRDKSGANREGLYASSNEALWNYNGTMSARMEASLSVEPANQQASRSERQTALELALELDALLRRQEPLWEDIKRGKECLDRVQRERAERESRLEERPTYERQCGADCLPHLTESVSSPRRVARFLNGWLARKQDQLTGLDQAISPSPGNPASRRVFLRLAERGGFEPPIRLLTV